jgi:uncharacterized protein with HEPN domain
MSRDARLYLEDILEACDKVRRFTEGMSQAQFLKDERTYDAVVRNLQIIGEAAKRVPSEFQSDLPQVEWRKAAGLRDMLTHAYFGIDADILWDVIRNRLPPMASAIRAFLKTP